jgi:hypothetical protein
MMRRAAQLRITERRRIIMTLKLELNDWEALSVEVALVTLQERWMAKSRDGAGAPALASLQILIDKVWKAKAQQGSLGQFHLPRSPRGQGRLSPTKFISPCNLKSDLYQIEW